MSKAAHVTPKKKDTELPCPEVAKEITGWSAAELGPIALVFRKIIVERCRMGTSQRGFAPSRREAGTRSLVILKCRTRQMHGPGRSEVYYFDDCADEVLNGQHFCLVSDYRIR